MSRLAVTAAAGRVQDEQIAFLEVEAHIGGDGDPLASPVDMALGARAGLAPEETPGRELETVGIALKGHAVFQDLVDPSHPEPASVLTPSRRIRSEAVFAHPEEAILHLHGFDRNVAAVGQGAVHAVAAVGMRRGAVAAAEDFQVNPVSVIAQMAEANRLCRVEAAGDNPLRHGLAERAHHGAEGAIGGRHARAHRRGGFRIENAAIRRAHRDGPLGALVERDVGTRQHRFDAAQDRRGGR